MLFSPFLSSKDPIVIPLSLGDGMLWSANFLIERKWHWTNLQYGRFLSQMGVYGMLSYGIWSLEKTEKKSSRIFTIVVFWIGVIELEHIVLWGSVKQRTILIKVRMRVVLVHNLQMNHHHWIPEKRDGDFVFIHKWKVEFKLRMCIILLVSQRVWFPKTNPRVWILDKKFCCEWSYDLKKERRKWCISSITV